MEEKEIYSVGRKKVFIEKDFIENMGEHRSKNGKGRKKFIKNIFYIIFVIFFLILNIDHIKGETSLTQSIVDIHKLQFNAYMIIEPISEKEATLEVIMCFTNVSSEQINWIMTVEIPDGFIIDPQAEWSFLDSKKWEHIPPDGKIKKEVNILPGDRDGIIVRTIEPIEIKDEERCIAYKVFGNMHYNSIEVKIPVKENIIYKIDYIRWELPPDSVREEEGYRILKWEKPTLLQTGELTNIFKIYYKYRVPVKEYFMNFLKEIGVALLGVTVGVLSSEKIKKYYKKLKNKIKK